MIKFTKRAFALAAALMIALSSSAVFATRTTTPASSQGTVTIEQPQTAQTATPAPAPTQTTEENEPQTTAALTVPTPVAVTQESNVVETGQNQKEMEKRYASKGFVILWFFLGLIINAIISFMIANRFYKLARRENHVASEVRALRRDLEDKFIKSVDSISEMETDVTNTNENYSVDGSVEEIATKSFSKESEDIFRQWESKMARRTARAMQKPEIEEIVEEVLDEPKRVRKYQPLREANDADAEEAQSGIKDKAKEIIGNIFPFKE